MNWLAHLFLSEATPEFRVGNLLPDILSAPELKGLPAEFQRGIVCHRQIDAFTDSHPIVRSSLALVSPPFRRFSGIMMDLFYDHFLACDWAMYSDATLEEFCAAMYASFDEMQAHLPPFAAMRLGQIKEGNLLYSYRQRAGIEGALTRIGDRMRRPVDLTKSIEELDKNYEALHGHFTEFFAELRSYVAKLPQLI